MAKRVCRTADLFDPTGMPRPRCRVRRVPPPSPAAVVHDILQPRIRAHICPGDAKLPAELQAAPDHISDFIVLHDQLGRVVSPVIELVVCLVRRVLLGLGDRDELRRELHVLNGVLVQS